MIDYVYTHQKFKRSWLYFDDHEIIYSHRIFYVFESLSCVNLWWPTIIKIFENEYDLNFAKCTKKLWKLLEYLTIKWHAISFVYIFSTEYTLSYINSYWRAYEKVWSELNWKWFLESSKSIFCSDNSALAKSMKIINNTVLDIISASRISVIEKNNESFHLHFFRSHFRVFQSL